jgi:hypothetical protein
LQSSSGVFGARGAVGLVSVGIVPIDVQSVVVGVDVDTVAVSVARSTFLSHIINVTGILRAKLLRFSSTQRVFFCAERRVGLCDFSL